MSLTFLSIIINIDILANDFPNHQNGDSLKVATASDVSGVILTPTGEPPYKALNLIGLLSKSSSDKKYFATFTANGEYTVLTDVGVKDIAYNNKNGIIDVGGADAAANLKGRLATNIEHTAINGAIITLLGNSILAITDIEYDPISGEVFAYQNLSSLPGGFYLARLYDNKGTILSTKLLNNPSGDNSRKDISLENITSQASYGLKSGQLEEGYNFTVSHTDDYFETTTYENVPVEENQATSFNATIEHKGESPITVKLTDESGNPVTNQRVIFEYAGSNTVDGPIRDTVFVTNATTDATVDLDRVGYDAMAYTETSDDYEEASQIITLNPENNTLEMQIQSIAQPIPKGNISGDLDVNLSESPYGASQYVGTMVANDGTETSFTIDSEGKFNVNNLSLESGAVYTINIDDENNLLNDISETVTLQNGQTIAYNKVMTHAVPATFNLSVENENNVSVTGFPITYTATSDANSSVQKQVTSATTPISIDLDETGYNVNALLQYVEGASSEFENKTVSNITLVPGTNNAKTHTVQSIAQPDQGTLSGSLESTLGQALYNIANCSVSVIAPDGTSYPATVSSDGSFEATNLPEDVVYDISVTDNAGNITDKVFDVDKAANTTDFVGQLSYAKNATQNMAIRRSDGNTLDNVPIIFSYNNDAEKRDTIWITEVPQVIEVDINKVGINPTYEIPNGFEQDNLPNPILPFKTTNSTATFIPGTNQEKAYAVQKYLDEQKNIQIKYTDNVTPVGAGCVVEVTYLDDNNRVETYTTNSNSQITLERLPQNDRALIQINSNSDYYGQAPIIDAILTYNQVKTEAEQTSTTNTMVQKRLYLDDGTPITANEIRQMFDNVSLIAHNDKQNVYHAPSYGLDKERAEQWYNNLDNWFGTNFNLVESASNPTRAELEAGFPENTFNDELTNIISGGSPTTVPQEMTLPTGKSIFSHATITDTGAENSFYKENMRGLGIYASDRSTGIMADNANATPDQWELKIIPEILQYQKTFTADNIYKTLDALTD
ncbi:hypothetical protein [Labilibacter marinus]|uniref:hypothetical protein n=1 Tax=Labilibacter marinus TaxID=1477105 RepID=UPI00117A93D0|nr:hypothetical protein [Labilibacter marinus]